MGSPEASREALLRPLGGGFLKGPYKGSYGTPQGLIRPLRPFKGVYKALKGFISEILGFIVRVLGGAQSALDYKGRFP